MPLIQVREISINYQIYNANSKMETIVFIHDLGHNQDIWEPILPFIQQHYRVVVLDLRGHGRTERGTELLSWDLFIQDLFQFIIKVELGAVHLMGHGFGATLAVKFSLQHADLVKSLVLLAVPAFLPRETVDSVIQSRKQLTSNGDMLTLAESMVQGISKLPPDSSLFKKMVTAYMTVQPETYFEALELYAGAGTNEDFASLSHPTLALVGADDSIYLSSTALSSQLLMHSSVIVVPEATNTLFIDQPQFVSDKVYDFIQNPSEVLTDYASFECHVAKYVMQYFNDAFEKVLTKKAVQV
ncbi:alpha/beta fold hydrolase [Paenibacillus sp. YAF4_2]|uniref:alpha/beta fold hydrolase n=1 Tax=Paenibacillus sp. YAF4_2 TaxID=3233085 RepID=UPI003F970622